MIMRIKCRMSSLLTWPHGPDPKLLKELDEVFGYQKTHIINKHVYGNGGRPVQALIDIKKVLEKEKKKIEESKSRSV